MKKAIKIFYDQFANSLVVWFDDPQKEAYASEAEDEVIHMKDKDGNVIGFEKLNHILSSEEGLPETLPLEVMTSASVR